MGMPIGGILRVFRIVQTCRMSEEVDMRCDAMRQSDRSCRRSILVGSIRVFLVLLIVLGVSGCGTLFGSKSTKDETVDYFHPPEWIVGVWADRGGHNTWIFSSTNIQLQLTNDSIDYGELRAIGTEIEEKTEDNMYGFRMRVVKGEGEESTVKEFTYVFTVIEAGIIEYTTPNGNKFPLYKQTL